MTSKSHRNFSSFLLKEMNGIPLLGRIAFFYGSIEPDINIVTYLKGVEGKTDFHGHNFPNMLPRLRVLLNQLMNLEVPCFVYCYRLGKLSHYLTDLFTYPHNPTFKGSIKAHVQYEHLLEKQFLKELDKERNYIQLSDIWSIFLEIISKHEDYLKEKAGTNTDCLYTLSVVPTVIFSLYSNVLCEKPVQIGEVSYENPVNI